MRIIRQQNDIATLGTSFAPGHESQGSDTCRQGSDTCRQGSDTSDMCRQGSDTCRQGSDTCRQGSDTCLVSILGTSSLLDTAGGGSMSTSLRGHPPTARNAHATCEARTAPKEAPMRSKGFLATIAPITLAYAATMFMAPSPSSEKELQSSKRH